LQPAADEREHRQDGDRPRHGEAALEPGHVEVLAREGAHLAPEDDEEEAEGVEGSEEGADRADPPQDPTERPRVGGACQDRVLREEARERRHGREGERADYERAIGVGKAPAQAAHAADVLLVGERVDDDAGGQEEERLEEGVRHEMEEAGAVRPQADCEEHVADLAHGRVRDDALDVRLDERDQPGEQDRDAAEDPGEVLDVRRELEEHVGAGDEVDAGRDHRRRMDEGGDGRRALHRVGKPRLQWHLGGLRHGAAEEAERDQDGGRRGLVHDSLLEDRTEVQRAGALDKEEEGEHEGRIADRIHDERLLAGGDRRGPEVPEVDEQIRGEADHPPAGK
jgi:hypothetical protein